MITFPNAKINIGLNVTERRPDGYHNLDTVFYPIQLQDALEVIDSESKENDCILHLSGTPLEGKPEDNLVVKAYHLLKEDYPLPPVHVYLYKHIPSGSGLGGGSSDAAFMLKLLNEKFKLNLSTKQLEAYASRLGADCAFFIQNKPMHATGIGNVFTPIDLDLRGMTLVLVKPEISVSTKEAYSQIKPRIPIKTTCERVALPVTQWKECMDNDFENCVFRLHPELAAIKDKLYELGAIYAAMSGSGSCIYGLFNTSILHVEEIFQGCFCRQRIL